jgi:hypothetical protein
MRMSKVKVTRAIATKRAADLVNAVANAPEWRSLSPAAVSLTFMDVREPLRHIFDVYEGHDGEEWLGILEWATIEEARYRGEAFEANSAVVSGIIERMQGHPDVELSE